MAWIPTNPEAKQINGPPVSRDMDVFKVLKLTIDGNTAGVLVCYAEGYEDDDGEFVQHTLHEKAFVGDEDELVSIMGAACDPAKNVYQTIRDGAYQLLADTGTIPAGAPA